eukprot:CAMPEP_0173328008 /NCGR_PEP_ID=MMETSP1144-20121109/1922_1 /TAXON_ID=483371 /ORGANISM="non described non described, Strain CCMP2298" /LENGTH=106 /DNA_ID=CAMNT_0014272461 /DNA_START=211 /DNA_END=527 /DNA_ORIENTATION=+
MKPLALFILPLLSQFDHPISWEGAHYVIVASRETAQQAQEWGDALTRTTQPSYIRSVASVSACYSGDFVRHFVRSAVRKLHPGHLYIDWGEAFARQNEVGVFPAVL